MNFEIIEQYNKNIIKTAKNAIAYIHEQGPAGAPIEEVLDDLKDILSDSESIQRMFDKNFMRAVASYIKEKNDEN